MWEDVVTIKVLSWLAEKATKGAAGSLEIRFVPEETETVGSILERLVAEKPELAAMLLDLEHTVLQPNVNIILNERVFELAGGYDAPLKGGDTLIIFPAFSDG